MSEGKIRLGVLQAGHPPSRLEPRFGDYPTMFKQLLGKAAFDYAVFDVDKGAYPSAVEACDAYLVTGAAAGVYDPLPWIARLKDFLVQAQGRAALVGVCFGHQVMAEAFGGKVIQSPKGWGVGLQTYQVREHRPWMDDAAAISVPGSHQDQVVEPPSAARVVAASDFTPFGMLAYDDQPAISLQLHPEFEPPYAKALIEGRRGMRIPEEAAEAAIESLDQPNDNARVGGWIGNFLRRATAR
jgi:GMP synthase-like glutamine amidotransferase